MSTTRTDIHRPSAINPEDYAFVGIEYDRMDEVGSHMVLAANRIAISNHMKATGGTWSRHEHGGNCQVCGAAAIYTAVFYHEDSNSYIRTGFDCASKLDMGDPAAFRSFRAAVRDAREAQAGKRKAAALLADAGLEAAWEWYTYNANGSDQKKLLEVGALFAKEGAHPDGGPLYYGTREFDTLCDIVSKVVRYGNLSEAQAKYLRTLVDRILRSAEIKAEREAERAAALDAPEGRQTVDLEVLKVELRDSNFGEVLRMTAKHADGWLCWGTVPRRLSDIKRGDRIKLTATFSPSDTDAKFAFFKRPNGELI